MKTISLLGRGALLTASACLMLACNDVNGAHSGSNNAPVAAASPAASLPVAAATPAQAEDTIPRIKPEEAKKLVDEGKAVLVDVRGPDAYKMNHIKGALEVQLSRIEAGDYGNLPKNKRIIAYCSCGAEQTSKRAAELLEKAGYKGASALLGGNQAWESAGYPVEKAPAAAPARQ
jgi:rhodanese-related sulfurtransferase